MGELVQFKKREPKKVSDEDKVYDTFEEAQEIFSLWFNKMIDLELARVDKEMEENPIVQELNRQCKEAEKGENIP